MRKPAFESKRTILEQLSAERFISGTELAEHLAISRSAIARHISELQQLGVDIYVVKGKGYKLATSLDLIDVTKLAALTECYRPDGAELHVFPLIDSTNQFWLNRQPQTPASASVCFAECQSAGRGRRGRAWQSPFGGALYCSVWWRSEHNLSELMGLSVAIGLALTRWLVTLGAPAQVKWPNDIYIKQQKVAGILVELESGKDGKGAAVIGVGLNIKLPSSTTAAIDQPWTELSQWLTPLPSRTEIAAGLYRTLIECLNEFESGGLQQCLADWSRHDVFADQAIRLLMGDHQVAGICRGVDGQGALVIENEQGRRSYFGGEISVRPVDAVD
ncbi:bifunctional biotin--[acetyl-CoA-carboxylase] ligase/biotin operon repressor BirA [Neiella sp. HB171785]|uniref:Bifunctional ligase/repressor BirA n=1 Tax=Neiella litorisoli TaxID=2771431 RepID=A0A8J6QUX1_9GAMM|nr:bifunctional biotin--[acetyl-CoA-carboxylase] ligase/biotin operon repressor BirA [Neiella litorisoli]MBD1390517.1 bifunctional biotin--[acetyl-CoA-carboxylase] ligase/biotin operon repressor BirA [Neiella litorisoli]